MISILVAIVAAPNIVTLFAAPISTLTPTSLALATLPENSISTPLDLATIPQVPFYSQFKDITAPKWQKVGCGVASLAMVINYYQPDAVSVNALLTQGIKAGAYDYNAGWIYKGLIQLSQKYSLDGKSYDFSKSSGAAALQKLTTYLTDGPVIVSVHYKFDPKSTIPHLVVINGISNDVVYYNDPAAKSGEKQISTADFLKGWKKKFIVIRPTKPNGTIALALR